MFITVSPPLVTNNIEIEELSHDSTNDKNTNSNDARKTKVKPPLPIFVRNILDFIGFHNKLINLIGSEIFLFK